MKIIAIIMRALSGTIALLFGRRFFWLFLAIVGFIAGFLIGNTFFPDAGQLAHILVGLGVGIVGAVLSRAAPAIIGAAIGFIASGAALVALVDRFLDPTRLIHTIIFILAGILGAYLVIRALDLGIVLLSSLTGAEALTSLGSELIPFNQTVHLIALLVLFVVGILFQLNLVKSHEIGES